MSEIDLRQLAVEREAPAPPAPPGSAGLGWLLIPAGVLLGFAGLVAYALRDSFSPPRAVTVMPVLESSSAVLEAPLDTPLFRAAGWAEPRPAPLLVTGLAEGVVEQVLVVEGEEVKAGQVVARLIAADVKLALESAEAKVDLHEAEVAGAKAALVAAKARHRSPAHLRDELADAEATLARAEAEAATLPSSLKAAQSKAAFAARQWKIAQDSGDAVAATMVEKARSEMDAAEAALKGLEARHKQMPAELAALRARRDARKERHEGRVDEARQLAEAEAGLRKAAAHLRNASAERAAARLRLERMEVRSAASGRVLAVSARPGTRLAGLGPSSHQDASTVLSLYDPASMQVRADVRLDDVPKVRPGQKCRIETAALPGQVLAGEVLLAGSQADIGKNTLGVKVAVKGGATALRPDMLCQVTFLAPPPSPGKEGGKARLLVPRSVVEDGHVWLADALAGVARRRKVELGGSAGELVEVVSGLSAQDRLIVGGREGLADGQRIRVTGEDETLGIK